LTGCYFLATRNPDTTSQLIDDIVKRVAPGANPNYGNALRIAKVARISFNNMRFKFIKTVKGLAASYIMKHAR